MKIDDLLEVHPPDSAVESPASGSSPCLPEVADETNLLRAWDRVRRNDGAAGVDGVSIADLVPQFPGLARVLADALVQGTYHPRPVLRVEVPKPSGGRRKLGIPVVIDRIVLQAVVQVLQPVFDPHFSRQSFAYRPGRGPLDAIRHLQQRLSLRSGWVLHFDVEDFFDSVAHAQVLEVISRRVRDPGLLRLVRRTLSCGVSEHGIIIPTTQGVAQGSPLSPLLANAVLDLLDQWLDRRGAVFARYADDCAVLVDTAAEGERLRDEVERFLAVLSLRLNGKKTSLTPPGQAEFLGFTFVAARDGRCRRIISEGSLADYSKAVETRLIEHAADGFDARVAAMKTLLDSWLGYYGATEDPKQVERVVAETEDAIRWSEWKLWATGPERQRQLLARNVETELARRAAAASEPNPEVQAALMKAFPPSFLRHQGAIERLPPVIGNDVRVKLLDYSGRLIEEPEEPAVRPPNASLPPTRCVEWSVTLLRGKRIALGVQLARCKRSLLPRILSVSLASNRHQIVVYW